ncbi:MAG: hypothetical protein ABSD73_09675 [Candidatus Bathyarchaeia archaeon]|jgi:hypothetical protein
MKYVSMINIKDDKFEVAAATTEEEIRKLGLAGFQKYDERKIGETHVSYYRRPKRFSVYRSQTPNEHSAEYDKLKITE